MSHIAEIVTEGAEMILVGFSYNVLAAHFCEAASSESTSPQSGRPLMPCTSDQKHCKYSLIDRILMSVWPIRQVDPRVQIDT